MKKITDFIVEKRNIILVIFAVLTVISLVMMKNVKINTDLKKYLPKDSETKIGNDIMEKEFDEIKKSTLNVMFKDLSKEEKEETLAKLKKLDGVDKISYDESSSYNKGKHTLYILEVDDYVHSKTAEKVYKEALELKPEAMSGNIFDEYKPVLKIWIIVLAIGIAMVILTILSESYIEPWLYLTSIGVAVFMNKGTNVFFPSVSNITDSITAILQLALSMDYSIILSNRYRQERETEANKVIAMKKALYDSFKAISSSSVTTVVGLLALVFMSFTIGKDLGFVLAKGVLFSLISIFFCLPALLLLFDEVIRKSKKRSIDFNLTKLGRFSYKTRFLQLFLILAAFLTAFILKGNIGILYTGSQQDEVGKVFPATNQMAIVYENKYEDLISNYCKELEQDKKVDKVLCYSNTLNEKLKYNELNPKFKKLKQDTEIDEYLIKLIYYNYYNKNKKDSMSLDEFIKFIKRDVYQNKDLEAKVDLDMKKKLDQLEYFATSESVNNERSSKDIASILEIDEKDAEKLFILYKAYHNNIKLSMPEFVNFVLNDLSKDPAYSDALSNDMLKTLERIKPLTNKDIITKEMSAKEIARLLDIDEELVNKLFLFYQSNLESRSLLTLEGFASLALSLKDNPNFNSYFNEDIINKLNLLKFLSNESNVTKAYTKEELTNFLKTMGLNIDASKIELLYFYSFYKENAVNNKLSLYELSSLISNLKQDPTFSIYASKIDDNKLNTLKFFSNPALINKDLSYEEMFNYLAPFNFTKDSLISLYDYYYILNKEVPEISLTFYEYTSFLLTINNNPDIKFINALSNKDFTSKLMTSSEIAEFLHIDITKVDAIYKAANKEKMSLKEFIQIAKDIEGISLDEKQLLLKALAIINNQDMRFDYKDMASFLKQSETDTLKVYLLKEAHTKTLSHEEKLSIKTLFTFISTRYHEDDSKIKEFFREEDIKVIDDALNIMHISSNKYNYLEMTSILSTKASVNKDEVKLLYSMSNYLSLDSPYQKNIKELINFIITNMEDPLIKGSIDKDKVKLANIINNNTSTLYNYKEVASILNLDASLTKKIYALYDYSKMPSKMTPYNFIRFILDNKNHPLLKGGVDKKSLNNLESLITIMNSTLSNKKYTAKELSKILNKDESLISLVYSLYNHKYLKEGNAISLKDFTSFLIEDVLTSKEYASFIDKEKETKLRAVNTVINNTINNCQYNSLALYNELNKLSNDLDYNLIDLVYIYHGSKNDYNDNWKMTVEEFVNYLHDDMLKDSKYKDFLDNDKKKDIIKAKTNIMDAKNLLVTKDYSRAIINTKYSSEGEETFKFIEKLLAKKGNNKGIYIIGDSPMALEMSKTFNKEMDYITLLTMLFIFVVVALTFKGILIPLILVLIIQCAVYITMAILSITGSDTYFIALLIVQAILMGATIDYAIVYTTYYKEMREKMNVKNALINAYNKSIHTILSSSSILIIVTLIVSHFADAIPAAICRTISQGTLCAAILIVFILPGVLASLDKIICRKNSYKGK